MAKKKKMGDCIPAQARFRQPEAPIVGTARPMFDQHVQPSKPFPKDVGCVYEGDKYAMCFESHTNGKAGK